jgi:cyclopropane-fatty-acyl-phospholipid synthase
MGPRDFAVKLWDGTMWPPDGGRQPTFVAHVKEPRLVFRIASRPNLVTIGRAYVEGDLEIEGDLRAAFAVGDRWINGKSHSALRRLLHAWSFRPELGRETAKIRAWRGSGDERAAVRFFYDQPTDFFDAWLDPSMVYTCAYFGNPDQDLTEAQERKLDLVCRKLALAPGDELLDIGCGWGGLVVHAAQRYGARAVGITLSEKQARFATARISALGLADRCRVEVRDFRELDGFERFDRVASVGMIEHLREPLHDVYYRAIWRLLRAGGLALVHGMTRHRLRPLRGGHEFLKRYLIPEHELLPISTWITKAEDAGFDVRDVEQLREHYGMTLDVWTERMRAAAPRAKAAVGDAMYRTFEVQMISMAHHFYQGNLGLHQVLLSKPHDGDARLPLTREHHHTPLQRASRARDGRGIEEATT